MKRLLILVFYFVIVTIHTPVFSGPLEKKIDSLIQLMTVEEKIGQVANNGFMTTPDNERLGIPGFLMDNGPHGVGRKTSTSFPVGIAMAATFDKDLIYRTGKVMGTEFHAYGIHVQLGPCIDLCRDPRNGRSAETCGEDPYLCAQAAENVIRGIQSTPTIAVVKHFNGVNRQDYRNESDITISEPLLMDHYGLNFRKAIQDGGSLSLMNSYNLINNQHAAENPMLLDTILRQRWGFPFFVMSDWAAVHDAEKAIEAGTDLCMGSSHYKKRIPQLLEDGKVDESILNQAVARVLRVKMLSGMMDHYPESDRDNANTGPHQNLALEAGRKTIILLKNKDGILPLDKQTPPSIALIGPSANVAQLDGFGSSTVKAAYQISPRKGLENKIGAESIAYTQGCKISGADTSGFADARKKAAGSDVVIFVGGLDEDMEGEGFNKGGDRKNGTVQLPEIQQRLIRELAGANPNLIVVLKSGGVCALENSIDKIKGLLYAFYPGQEGGNAIADVVFGDYNPAGRLPVTMPKNDSQIPEQNDDFTDDHGTGYRWYDQEGIQPQFAFGFGLSYTGFQYKNLQVDKEDMTLGENATVSVDVSNTGNRDGEEVVQLYLSRNSPSAPVKELAGFERVFISQGQTRTVKFDLTPESFYRFNAATQVYEVEPGSFQIRVGGSSDHLPLSGEITISPGPEKPDLKVLHVYTYPKYPRSGERVHFLATVQNIGTKATVAGVPLALEFQVNNRKVAWNQTWTESIPAGGMKMIAAGISEEGDGLVTLTESPSVIRVVADPENLIDEHRESNNYLEVQKDVTNGSPVGMYGNTLQQSMEKMNCQLFLPFSSELNGSAINSSRDLQGKKRKHNE